MKKSYKLFTYKSIVGVIIWILTTAVYIEYIVYGSITLVLFMGLYCLQTLFCIWPVSGMQKSDPLKTEELSKYQSSPISKEKAQELVSRLKYLMEEKQLYLKSDLSLTELADELSISPNYLSQIINQELGSSFYDFINSQRVKEAMKRLKSPASKKLTILAVAYEAGFNNKNSFNKAFKKFTGSTPSSFLKKHAA